MNEENKDKRLREGVRFRVGTDVTELPAEVPPFTARPTGAPVYHGFPLLPGSQKDGFVFGVITEPKGAAWGDAYVVAPDGSRAGIVWSLQGPAEVVVAPADAGRWGVYQFRFEPPVDSDEDLIRNFHSVLHRLKSFYDSAQPRNDR